MIPDTQDLVDLVGSRICHDLISPIGAISNGVELLTMNGDRGGPEIDLIAESVDSANARIRYFRIAFGAVSSKQKFSATETRAILRDISRGGKIVYDWQPNEDVPRSDVKLVFLLLQCFETAMPRGG
ncbi:MAG: histidine phosphotransferase family protein [Paracoccaceae bacterium]